MGKESSCNCDYIIAVCIESDPFRLKTYEMRHDAVCSNWGFGKDVLACNYVMLLCLLQDAK